MSTYILQKDFPGANAGTKINPVLEGEFYGKFLNSPGAKPTVVFGKEFVENNPLWFNKEEGQPPKILSFLRTINVPKEHIMFMSFKDGLKLFGIERTPDFSHQYELFTKKDIHPAFDGSIEIGGYCFFFINPDKL